MIADLIGQAKNRIIIMPGTGIRPENLKQLIQFTGAKEYHTTAKNTFKGDMLFRSVRTGSQHEEFEIENTDLDIVKEPVTIAESMS